MPRKIALLRDIDNYEHIRAVFLDHEHCSLEKGDVMQLEGLPYQFEIVRIVEETADIVHTIYWAGLLSIREK